MTIPTISVVIPTFQRRQGLPEVLDAIAADEYVSEIIVVVDGSPDGSLEYLQQRSGADPRIRGIWQQQKGDRAARQTGVQAATSDVVLLLDDDVVAAPGLGAGHARAHEGRTNTLVLGYMPTITPAVADRKAGDFATLFYAREYEKRCRAYEEAPDSILQNLWSGNMSLRREDALAVDFTGGATVSRHTDQDFGLRCAAKGMTALFDRSLLAHHSHSRDLRSFLHQARSQGKARRELSDERPDQKLWSDPRKSLSPPFRLAVSIAMRDPVYGIVRSAGETVVAFSGRLKVWPIEEQTARFLRHVELARGFQRIG